MPESYSIEIKDEVLEILLVHPGGPYYWSKDDCWSIPKGEINPNEDAFTAAVREFHEETGSLLNITKAITIPPFPQSKHKILHAFIAEGDLDASTIESNTFDREWPPGSGEKQEFPEIDSGMWFDLDTAMTKISNGQRSLIYILKGMLQDTTGE